MKLDKICRTCLLEKAGLKPLFGACVANMLMSCASIQVGLQVLEDFLVKALFR